MGERYDGQAWADWAIELDPKASWDQRAEWAGVKRSSMFRYKNGGDHLVAVLADLREHVVAHCPTSLDSSALMASARSFSSAV